MSHRQFMDSRVLARIYGPSARQDAEAQAVRAFGNWGWRDRLVKTCKAPKGQIEGQQG